MGASSRVGPEHPARLRLAGLAATLLMAAGAYGAGALPGVEADAGPRPVGASAFPWGYWPSLTTWLVGLAILAGAWWWLGRMLDRPEPATVSSCWLVLTGGLWALPLLLAPPTGSRDVYSYVCQGALWLADVDPYRVGVAPGGCPWSDAVPSLWRETPTPYGPLAVGLAGAVVAVARVVTGSVDGQLLVAVGLFRMVALAGGLLVAGYAPRLARSCGVDPAAATWLGLLSPLVAVHLVSGAHNDALLMGLVVAALAVAGGAGMPGRWGGWGMRRALGAGVLLGLAVAVKVTAVVALPFLILLAMIGRYVRPGNPARELVRTGILVVAGAGLTFAGLSAATGLGLGWIGALSDTGRLVQWTSLPTGLGMLAGYLLRVSGAPGAFGTAVAVARLIGLLVLAVIGVALVVRAWWAIRDVPETARRRVVTACGAGFVAAALLSPVFYPWYALTAVAVLAVGVADRRWRRRLGMVVLVLGFLVLPNGLGLAVLTKLPGALLDLVLVVVLAVVVRRERLLLPDDLAVSRFFCRESSMKSARSLRRGESHVASAEPDPE